MSLKEQLLSKIRVYADTIWKDKKINGQHEPWLQNFINSDSHIQEKQKINALFLLSKFTYMGNDETRAMLKSIFRDMFKYEIVKQIRFHNSDTVDIDFIDSEFNNELSRTRFLGVGNPSESGIHLLYYFRQENKLSKQFFINTHEVLNIDVSPIELRDADIKRYIFLDDFCGSGSQAVSYSTSLIEKIKTIDSSIECCYYMLCGTTEGINHVKRNTKFDKVDAVFCLDETFKCFGPASRYYVDVDTSVIDKDFSKDFCHHYGAIISRYPLGYRDGQLLIGFFHNTPDNTLPIFWSENDWIPIFKRYDKIY